ncbi:alpha-protein kinase 1 [Lepisosteus oculatus]|uniref:alpha-protein kinase 1 n=1 Tax=Lepisosteus oculatus TaxID=7918 RepID=UPI0035F500D9
MNKTRKPQELSRPCARCGPVSRSRLQTLHRKSRLTRKKSYLKSRAGYCILPALGDRHCWGLLLVGKAQSVALSSPVSTQCVTIDTMDLDKDMDSQEVVAMLEECRQATLAGPAEVSEDVEQQCQRCQGSLPADLRTLLQEAGEMKWPFVPEKWQYKQSVSPEDKTDLKDLISKNLPKLLNYLKAAIVAGDSVSALSAAFLIDRFLYWVDASHKLLQIAKALHKRYPTTPVAPQLVIRQARLSVNTGKLQKAEFILSSLINNSGATGCWVYQQESDRTLVQAVSIQIRGQILQKLGLWREAAELVWASLIGFCALPQPDKKGIGTSLGLLANILASMNDQEYEAFKTSPHVDFSCLKEQGHRLLSAAEAARRAVVCSRFSPLFVLTNAVIQGTCLLSYGLSEDCPPAERRAFLGRAKEAFEIGLLTKTEDDSIASRQELHTFVKAAFCLAAAHRWLGLGEEAAARAERTCREAMGLLYAYASARGREKDRLSQGIMGLVGGAKAALGVAGFPKSDGKSYVPDSYLVREEDLFRVRPDGFHGVVRRYAQYHASVCEAFQSPCGHPRTGTGGSGGACITALKTATEALETECGPWGRRGGAEARRREFARTRGCGHGAGSPAGDGGSSGSSSWHVVSGTGSSGGWEDLGDEARGPAGREGRDAGTLARGDGDGGHGGPESGPDWGASAMRELRLDGPGDGLDPVQPARMTTAAAGTGSPESAADSARPGAAGTFPFGADGQTFAAKGSGGVPACREDAETEDPSLGETDDVSPPPPLPVVSPSERPDHVPFHGAADSRLQDFYDMDTEAETDDDLMDPTVAATGDGVRRPRIYSPEDCASTRRALMPRGVPVCREDTETEDPSLGETDDVSPPPPLPVVSPSERPDHVPFHGAADSRLQDFYDMDTEAETADDLMDPPVAATGDGVSRPRIYSPEDCLSTRRALMPRGVPACCEDGETEDPSLGETDDVSPPPRRLQADHVPFDGAADSRLRDFYDMDTEAETADDLMDPPVAATGDGVRRPRIYSPEDCASTRRALMPRGVPACREDAETEDPSLGGTDDVSPPPPLPAVSPSERPDHVPFDGAAGSRPRDFYDMDTEAETADDLMDPPVAATGDGVSRTRISSKAGAEPHRRPGLSGSPPSPGTGSSFEMMESDPAGRFRSPDPQGGARASRKSAEAPDSAGGDRAGSRSALVPASSTEEQRFFGEVTEEGGGEDGEGDEQLALPLSVSHSSASSGRSFFWSSQYSSSFSDVGSPSLLSSSGDSFVLVPGLTRVEVLKERTLSEDDYRRLLSGVGHTWLLNRLKYTGVFKPKRLRGTHNALLLKYSKVSDSWSARETQVHIGASTGKKGKQRSAFWVQFLHQEEVLGSYVGKEYQSEKELRYHLNDVERQMTAQYYVTEFNKKLYEKQIPMQIYFIPSEVLLILEDRLIKGCVSVEPYMLGDFVKLTNNKKTVVRDYRATDYGIAFGHFTFEFSGHTEIVVDLQGWVTGNGKGLTYLTDPQIHSLKKPKSSSNFYRQGIEYFLQDQHGADCNEICQMLSLGKLPGM